MAHSTLGTYLMMEHLAAILLTPTVTITMASPTPPPGSKSISQILTEARSHLKRITPNQALTELQAPATPFAPPVLLVDIRPAPQRAAEGEIAGSLAIERNVLEWRFDPRCEARLAVADRYDLRVIVMCQEGYTSSLAARALQELGLENATDLEGGYHAWKQGSFPDRI